MKTQVAFESRHFWDVVPSQLDVKAHASFIIDRLLEWGDLEEIHWLLGAYPLDLLRERLKRCRSLSKKSAAFWALILEVPSGEITCIRKQSDPQQKNAWPY